MIWYVQGKNEVMAFDRRRPAIEFARQQVAEGRGPHWPVHS